jgi:CheY-like chemotaxis protein
LSAIGSIQGVLMRDIPVILITGDTAPDRIREAYEAGHFLLHKPVNPRHLRTCMAEAWTLAQTATTASPRSAV